MSRRVIVITYTIFILAVLPFAREMWDFIGDKNGVFLVLGLTGGCFGFLYIRIEKIILIPIAVILSGIIFKLVPLSIERIHFIEYGILGWMSYRTFGRQSFVYLVSVGILDELIQWLLPDRIFDFRDIFMNFTGGSIGFVMRKYA